MFSVFVISNGQFELTERRILKIINYFPRGILGVWGGEGGGPIVDTHFEPTCPALGYEV